MYSILYCWMSHCQFVVILNVNVCLKSSILKFFFQTTRFANPITKNKSRLSLSVQCFYVMLLVSLHEDDSYGHKTFDSLLHVRRLQKWAIARKFAHEIQQVAISLGCRFERKKKRYNHPWVCTLKFQHERNTCT